MLYKSGMTKGHPVMVRMTPKELKLLDAEVKRLGKLCSPLSPMTRSAVLRLALWEFAFAKKEPPWISREGPAFRDSVLRWAEEWMDVLEDRAELEKSKI
jgi:hypothetical protein